MPKMDGLEFSAKLLELEVNPKICLMSAGMINQEALREPQFTNWNRNL